MTYVFELLLSRLNNSMSCIERQNLIEAAASQYVFTCQQLGVILMALKYPAERRVVASKLASSIVDPENAAYHLRPFLSYETASLRTDIIQLISSSAVPLYWVATPTNKMSSRKDLLSISLSQDHSCFVCGMESGVSLYNIQPLTNLLQLDFGLVGGVSHVEILGRTNILVLVGGGQAPKFPHHSVMIWDDSMKKFVFEVAFGSPVLSLRIRKDKLVVILLNELHIFSFPTDFKLLTTIPTSRNPRGLCEVCTSIDCQLMIYPGSQTGTIQISDLLSIDLPDKASTDKVCQAHQHEIACIALNQSGTLIASASSKGTLIRIHNSYSRVLLAEFRRGTDPANIFCFNSAFLCVSSDKGTVHIFAIEDQSLNRKSSLAQVGISQLSKAVGTYVQSQWDCAHFNLPSETSCLCLFSADDKSILAICMDGTFHKYSFNLDGQCHRESFDVFLDIRETDL